MPTRQDRRVVSLGCDLGWLRGTGTCVRGQCLNRRDRWRPAFVVALLMGALLPITQAQPGVPGVRGAGGGMATRSVSRYLGLERGLQEALDRRDRGAVVALMADDFTLRTSATADVESSDDWLRREFASAPSDGLVRDLSVREVDDLAVVSFLLDRGPAGRRAAATWFIVDIWRQSTQRLLSRSMTRAVGSSLKPSRPSGKE